MLTVQERIVGALEEHGYLLARDVPKVLKDIDHIALDVALTALMRQNRITRELGRYELIPAPEKPLNGTKQVAVALPDGIPSAAEEAAANLGPVMRQCERCLIPKELNEQNFTRNRHGFLKICKVCYGASVSAGREGKCIPVSNLQPAKGDSTNRESPAVTEAISNATPGATLTGEGSQPPAGEPSRPRELPEPSAHLTPHEAARESPQASTPRIEGSAGPAAPGAEVVLARVRAELQGDINKHAVMQVDLANLASRIAEREKFLEMFERFAQGAA